MRIKNVTLKYMRVKIWDSKNGSKNNMTGKNFREKKMRRKKFVGAKCERVNKSVKNVREYMGH